MNRLTFYNCINHMMLSVQSVIVLNLVLLNVAICQDVGKICTLEKSGASGVCKLLTECEQIRHELLTTRSLPQTCGFRNTQPIVCCPKSRNPGEISKQKCKQYSSYASADNTIVDGKSNITKNECGHNIVKRIVGGVKAKRKEFPHMAAIGFEKDDSIQWLCGGTIISENYILTVAHCLSAPTLGEPKHVLVGVTNLNDNNHKQIVKIADRIPHPEYKRSEQYHDIGLLKLEKPIHLNSYARPACLNYALQRPFGKVIATGWGTTDYAGQGSEDLLKVSLDIVEHEVCKLNYTNSRQLPKGLDDDVQICAGLGNLGKDTCQGDTGGPIQMYHNGDEITCMYDVVGITSFGKGCFGGPSIYTRVSHYVKWIEDTVWA